MRVSRFHTSQSIRQGEEIRLEGTRAHYIRNVLRLKSRDPLILFNGQGGEFRAQISQIDRAAVLITVGEFNPINRQSALPVELGLALVKKDAMDAAIQKSTELSVHKINPLITSNTSVSTRELDKRRNHWQEISYSACEQCGLNIPSEIGSVETYTDWISQVTADLKLIASPVSSGVLLDESTMRAGVAPESVAIAIGPEGGFTNEELVAAADHGFTSIKLGTRVLRTETAATTLLALIQFRWGDLS